MEKEPRVSVVIPCLNEERTLGLVITEARDALFHSLYSYEIVVADNGSTDHSRKIAESLGARVVPAKTLGYGAALRTGVLAAKGSIIILGDADYTYDFKQAPQMVARLLQADAEMVLGSRIKGMIEEGAMPALHHYLGTPVLTYLINVLFGGNISDCNSGFRAFRRERFLAWNVSSPGMEFASELIVNCLKAGDRIVEIPVTLRKDIRNRAPHLQRWRDGMRHLLFILSRAPQGFTYGGLVLLGLSLCLAIPSSLFGLSRIGPFTLFDYHSMIVAIITGFLGSQAIVCGLVLDLKAKNPLPMNGVLLRLSEVLLLKILLALCTVTISFVLFLFLVWVKHGFNTLHYLRQGLAVLYATVVVGGLGLGLFMTHVYKRVGP